MSKRKKKRYPPRLLVYGVSTEEWMRRYGVEPFTAPCQDCGTPLTTTIPFVEGTLRGLKAPRCVCGQDQAPYALVLEGPHGLAGLT
jgi:hypothetical protein